MTDDAILAERFEQERPRLHAVAFRLLGSASDADDAVQEAWLRLHRTDAASVDNLSAWLTTVVARVSLDQLRSRSRRREEMLDPVALEPVIDRDAGSDPEHEALMTDAIGPALLVVLDALRPDERLALVLHDMFGVAFDEVAGIVGVSPENARQLASRARRRVRGFTAEDRAADRARQREIVRAFLAAARAGEFDRLLELLAPDAELTADDAEGMGVAARLEGASAVAGRFAGGAQSARLALIDGVPGLVWSQGGQLRVAFCFEFEAGRVTAIRMVSQVARLSALSVQPLTADGRVARGG